MLSRMKFEIEALVEEMLDQLPETVWTSNSTTFFDPAIGGGQFVRAIEQRLRERGHSDVDRKSTRLNSSHMSESRMPSSA